MITIGLLRESKVPADNRVALTPAQCKWIHKNVPEIRVLVQASRDRCYSDKEYRSAGIEVRDELGECDLLFGIKEVPVNELLPGKTYLFFSHTKKMQPGNQEMFRAILDRQITLIDYECLEHDDGQRILGFGFFAGVVGAHNGIMAYGLRTGRYTLGRVHRQQSFRELIHTYFGLRLPEIKVVVTGSGRVAHGALEVMNLLEIVEVEPDEFLERSFHYPVFTQLKGAALYGHARTGEYHRDEFHSRPQDFRCKFLPFAATADILINGIYWDKHMPRLFEWTHLAQDEFHVRTIADITDDRGGSVPCNLGEGTMENPVYGVDPKLRIRTQPYLPGCVDVMAVGNLPNELPRDASRYFGEQLIKHVLNDVLRGGSVIVDRATMVRRGELTLPYRYLADYARGDEDSNPASIQ
jgi:saccharopine dehydrogenase (NAD+, L-lysine-forming)